MAADTGFPTLSQGQSTEEKIEKITSYLFMLLEQLRYSMGNLDKGNFNEAGLEEIAHIITAPVYVQLKDAEGNIANIQADAKALSSRMSDAEGGLSSLVQTVNGMTLAVSQGEKSSIITLTGNGITAKSALIEFDGLVSFKDLKGSGTTTINGDNITTGTITGCTFSANMIGQPGDGTVEFCNYGQRVGAIYLDIEGAGSEIDGKHRMFITTEDTLFSLKLQSAKGISMEAANDMYIYSNEGVMKIRSDTGIEITASNGGNAAMGYRERGAIHAKDYIDIRDGEITIYSAGTINLVGDVRVNGSSIG